MKARPASFCFFSKKWTLLLFLGLFFLNEKTAAQTFLEISKIADSLNRTKGPSAAEPFFSKKQMPRFESSAIRAPIMCPRCSKPAET